MIYVTHREAMPFNDQTLFFLIFNPCVLDRLARYPFQQLSASSLHCAERESHSKMLITDLHKIQSWCQTIVSEK